MYSQAPPQDGGSDTGSDKSANSKTKDDNVEDLILK